MGKLAILTLYDDMNFGNKLQNYAVQCYFEALGFQAETLPCTQRLAPRRSAKRAASLAAHFLLRPTAFEKARRARLDQEQARRRCIGAFSQRYIHLGPDMPYSPVDPAVIRQYDYFVTGSDQVWHYAQRDERAIEYFLLTFAAPEQRLTMAPSFAFDVMPPQYADIYKKGLAGFPYISVREERGAELVKELTGQEATVLLDPTMLVDTEQWLRILRRPEQAPEGAYIFVYALGGYGGETRQATEALAAEQGYAVVDVMDRASGLYTHTRPDEFLWWIRNAALVVTDSFHAAVFSILFGRPFVVAERGDSPGMGSRLDTLLGRFGLTDRRFERQKAGFYDPAARQSLFAASYDGVPAILAAERAKAAAFYDRCLSKGQTGG